MLVSWRGSNCSIDETSKKWWVVDLLSFLAVIDGRTDMKLIKTDFQKLREAEKGN